MSNRKLNQSPQSPRFPGPSRARSAVVFFTGLIVFAASLACRGESKLKEYPMGGDFTLTGHDGRPFTLSEYRQQHPGDPVLLFFGFTHCPDVCPQTMSRLSRATSLLDSEDRRRVLTLLVTVDPARDDPAALKKYLSRYPLRSLGLSGSRAEITRVAKLYAVNFYERGGKAGEHTNGGLHGDHGDHGDHRAHADSNAPAGGGLINHSPQTFLIDGSGKVRYLFRPNDPVKDIAETIRLLL